jgi:hypothetical protein
MHQAKLSLLVITAILATNLPAQAQPAGGEGQSTDLIGAGVSLLKNLLDPPSRKAEISADTELKKAKIAAEAEITKEKMRLEATKAADADAKKEKAQVEAKKATDADAKKATDADATKAADADDKKEKTQLEAKNADKVTPVLTKWGVSRVNCAPGLVFISGLGNDTVCIQPSPSMVAGAYTYDSAKQQLVRTSGGTASTATSEKNDGETIQKVQSSRVSKNGNSVKTTQSTKVSSPAASDEGF